MKSGTAYSYDPENRLTVAQDYKINGAAKRIDGAVTTLGYDGMGRRLAQTYDPKVSGGGAKPVQYTFDGLDPVVETSMWNKQYDNYYRGALGRISVRQHFPAGTEGQLTWYDYNSKGDVVGLSKQSGQSIHNYQYDPYGSVLPQNGNFTDPHNHYTLTGKETDENTGLVYFGARHYDPSSAQWITQDTYRGATITPLSLHRYNYNYSNPVSYFDAYGYLPQWIVEHKNELALGLAVGGAVIATIATGGLAAPILAGALVAGATTVAINAGSGQNLMADVAENTLGGAMIGLSVGMGGQLTRFLPAVISNPALYAPLATEFGGLTLMTGGLSLALNPSKGVNDQLRNIGNTLFSTGMALQMASDAIGLCRSTPSNQDENIPTLGIDSSKMPNIARNISSAQSEGAPTILTRITNNSLIKLNRQTACSGFCGVGSPDEYPFASTSEGGLGAFVQGVPLSEQYIQGGVLRNFYSKNNIQDGGKFMVVVK